MRKRKSTGMKIFDVRKTYLEMVYNYIKTYDDIVDFSSLSLMLLLTSKGNNSQSRLESRQFNGYLPHLKVYRTRICIPENTWGGGGYC